MDDGTVQVDGVLLNEEEESDSDELDPAKKEELETVD